MDDLITIEKCENLVIDYIKSNLNVLEVIICDIEHSDIIFNHLKNRFTLINRKFTIESILEQKENINLLYFYFFFNENNEKCFSYFVDCETFTIEKSLYFNTDLFISSNVLIKRIKIEKLKHNINI
jgi:hypothetical protein